MQSEFLGEYKKFHFTNVSNFLETETSLSQYHINFLFSKRHMYKCLMYSTQKFRLESDPAITVNYKLWFCNPFC